MQNVLIVYLFLVPLTLTAGSVQPSGRRQAGLQFCLFSFTPAWKMPFSHSETHNKDNELRGAGSTFCAPAPSTGGVMPVLVPWGYNLLLEEEQFLWTKVIFREIITLGTYKPGGLVLQSLLASATNNRSVLLQFLGTTISNVGRDSKHLPHTWILVV